MQRQAVSLLFGGKSTEHDVSLLSAANVYRALDRGGYDVALVYISREGAWHLVDNVRAATEQDEAVTLDLGAGSLITSHGAMHPDVVFPVLHGKYGEDGTIQGLLDMMNLPYVGCGVEASALCMDKVRAKNLLRYHGVTVVPDIALSVDQLRALGEHLNESRLREQLGDGPWFVKPSRSGSSVGVKKVHDYADIFEACEQAFEHDNEILIERAVGAMHEVEVAVMGNAPDIIVSEPGEIVPGQDFYSYEDKYSPDATSYARFELPELISHLSDAIKDEARRVYTALGCRGLSRVDFFVTDDGEIYVNEINTMPGFTNISMFPKLMERAGYTNTQLVDKLIEYALQ